MNMVPYALQTDYDFTLSTTIHPITSPPLANCLAGYNITHFLKFINNLINLTVYSINWSII